MCHYRPLKGPFKVSPIRNDILASDNDSYGIKSWRSMLSCGHRDLLSLPQWCMICIKDDKVPDDLYWLNLTLIIFSYIYVIE